MASPFSGRCECGAVVYDLAASPLFVHACHCLDCKRKSGSAFAITTIILEGDFTPLSGALDIVTPKPGRTEHVCAACRQYLVRTSAGRPHTALLNTRTFDDSRCLTIGAHIWIERKHPSLIIPPNEPQFEGNNYDRDATWSAESLARLRAAMSKA
jgi:hypothetical protein